MAAERTRMVSRHYLEYLKKKKQELQAGKKVVTPLHALTFDQVELSSSSAENTSDYTWLTTYIQGLSNEEVARKMKAYQDSYSTVDDAMTDKLMLELF